MRPTAAWLFVLTLATTVTTAAGQCGQGGAFGVPAVSVTSDLWDSDVTLRLENGFPGAPWLLLLGTSDEPQELFFGTLCCGTNAIVVGHSLNGSLPFLDPTGGAALPGSIPPALSSLIGFTFQLQALVVDPSAPWSIAITPGYAYSVRSPRVMTACSSLGGITVHDAHALVAGTPIIHDTIVPGDVFDMDASPDGERLFVRRAADVVCYDVSVAPATVVGAPLTAPGRTVSLSRDGAAGFAADAGWSLRRFGADPSAPDFMTVTASTSLSLGALALSPSPDGNFLYAVGYAGNAAPGRMLVIDPPTLTEVASIPLSDIPAFFGSMRFALDVSGDGRRAAAIQRGMLPTGAIPASGATLSIIDLDPASATYLQEVASFPVPHYAQECLRFDRGDPTGGVVYTIGCDVGGVSHLWRIDWVSQIWTSVALGPAAPSVAGGLDLSPRGDYLYVRSGAQLRVFDRALNQVSGTVTLPSTSLYQAVVVER